MVENQRWPLSQQELSGCSLELEMPSLARAWPSAQAWPLALASPWAAAPASGSSRMLSCAKLWSVRLVYTVPKGVVPPNESAQPNGNPNLACA